MAEADELEAWLGEVCAALGLPASLAGHRQLLLDVARDAAHGVMRPAAPLTTFLVGYAAGLAVSGGASPDDAVAGPAEIASALALSRGDAD